MSSGYRDFIPAGEDTGALGAGLTDFVPTPEPKKEPPKPSTPKQETPKQGFSLPKIGQKEEKK